MNKTRLKEILSTLRTYNYENEVGPLVNCTLFHELEKMAEPSEVRMDFPPLERPLCFFDVETTGTNVQQDRIVELAISKLWIEGGEPQNETKTIRLNPGIPIPKAASDVHGITDELVKDCPTFKQISKSLLEYIEGCDMAGFNSNRFDVPMLFYEFQRCGLYWDYRAVHLIDVGNIYKLREERTLTSAVAFYLERNHEGAHTAEADVIATAEVLFAQLGRYNDLPRKMGELALYSNFNKPWIDVQGKFALDADGEIVFNFGKHVGKKAKAHKDYLEWIVTQSDFGADVKKVANELLFS